MPTRAILCVLCPVGLVFLVTVTACRSEATEPSTSVETGPIRTASLSDAPTPRTTLPESPADLELPKLDAIPDPMAATRAVLREQIEILEVASKTLAAVGGYTAELTKQERIDGELGDRQRTRLKLRHAPFSVYMKWLSGDRGREVIYVDGENENKMAVHLGGWKARFLPVLHLDPNGSMAMGESRHPVTEAGLRHLIRRHLEQRSLDLKEGGMTSSLGETEFEGTPCYELTNSYEERPDREYSRTVLIVDRETKIPLAARNYVWGQSGDVLVESYEYRNLDLQASLGDADFNRKNKQYSFRN